MSDGTRSTGDHTRHDMLFDAIAGRHMSDKERILWGAAGVFALLYDLALVVAPVYVYTEYGFEPAVIAGLVALVMIQVVKE